LKEAGVIARASVPASIANLGSGFDVHAIALQSPRIEVELTRAPSGSRAIQVKGIYAQETTTNPNLHASGRALDAVLKKFGKPEGYVLTIQVNIPPRVGLGLSGAEAVGAVMCASVGLDLGLSRKDIARIAAKAEPMQHMDNVAASALGAFNIVTRTPRNEQPEITTIMAPKDLGVAVVVPSVEKTSTGAAREVLPLMVPREHYVESMSFASRISAALAHGDLGALLETLPWDPVVEPARANAGVYGKGIDADFLQEEKKLLIDRFHVAETISGAGPSRALWYSISENRRKKAKDEEGLIKPAIELVSNRLGSLGHSVREIFITKPSSKGATIMHSNRRSRRD
jgi:homoserine kinase